MAQSSGGHGQNFNPNLPSSAETQRQPVAMFTEPKGIDRYHLSSRVTEQLSPKIRNLMFDDGILVSRLGTDLLGGNAASPVMQVVDLVRKGQTKVTIRFCTRHVEVYEFGLGAWNSVAVPLTGSERDFFAYTGWADKILFSNGIDGIWEFDLKTYEAKLVPGSPSAKHLTTFGGRVVASSVSYRGENYPLRVWWTAKNLYKNWTTSQQNPALTPDLAGGYEDLYGSPGGITDEAMGVFPFSDSQAWLVRSRSVWQMAVSGNALAPFRFDLMLPSVGTPYRNSIISLGHAVVFASREDIHEVSLSGDKLIGTPVVDDILDEVESFNGCFGTYDVGRQEYRIAIGTLVWRYRWQEEGWTADQYPFAIRALSRQIQGIADIPIDNLPATIDELSGLFPPGAIDDLVYDRGFDNAMMFVPESTELTVVETDDSRDTLLTGEKTDSEFILETGVINKDQLKAIELHQVDVEYESQMDQQLLLDYTQVDGGVWLPLSVKDIEATEGSEILFVKQERLSRKFRLRLRSLTLGKLRLLGIAPYLVVVERPMPSRKPKPASIQILPGVLNLTVGGTQQLSITVRDSNGASIPNVSVTLISTNSAVATVSSSGLVRAISAGSFAIVASVRNISTSVTGTVSAVAPVPVATVTVTPAVSQGAAGTQQQYTATVRDANGNILLGRPVTWASSSPAFATINSSGLATLAAEGVVAISATVGGVTGGATLTITAAAAVVNSVEVTPGTFTGEVGQTVQLVASPKDSLGSVLSGKTISWASSATGIATVNAVGLVTMVGVGSVTITATCETIDGTSTGTVIAAVVQVASVTVTPNPFSISSGTTQALTATVKDASGNVLTGRIVTWTSSNASIATVNSSGVVTGVAAGTATITATCEGEVGTAAATVTPVAVASVTVSPATFNVNAGATTVLVATPKDISGNPLSNRVITWGSSDPTKATVSNTGVVTGIAAGSVTITATCETKSGNSVGTIGVATYSSVSANSGVVYVPEPNPSGSASELPRTYLNSRYNVATSFAFTTTLTNTNRTANTSALQSAIDAAAARQGNTKIFLPSPFPFGSIIQRKHAFAGSRTYVEALVLPCAEFTRCIPSNFGVNSPNGRALLGGSSAIDCDAGADGYRWIGIVFDAAPKTTASVIYDLIRIQAGNGDVLGDVPTQIWLDRCLIRGNDAGTGVDTGNVRNGVLMNGMNSGVVDCWIDQIGWTGTESHGIISTNTPGPLKFVNNYIEATSCAFFLGGDIPHLGVTAGRPSDVEVRHFYHTRRIQWAKDAPQWDGVQGRGIKNLIETKNCKRVLFEGGVCDGNWADGQSGIAVVIKSGVGAGPIGQPGAAGCGSEDVTLRHMKVRNSQRCWNFAALSDESDAIPAARCTLFNTLAYNIGTFGGATSGLAWLLTQGFNDLFIKHNTLVHNEFVAGIFNVDYPDNAQRFVFTDNLFSTGSPDYGVFMSGGTVGSAALAAWAPGYTWMRNVQIGLDPSLISLHPGETNQYATNVAAVQFVNAPGGNYRLSPSSPYKGDAEGGTDPGADIDKIDLATAGVEPSAGCGLDTSSSFVPESPLALPAYRTVAIEPNYGTQIIRIAGNAGTTIPVTGGLWPDIAGPGYAKRQAWSADGAYMIIEEMSGAVGPGVALLLDGTTYEVLGAISPAPSYTWHPTVPDILIGVASNGSIVTYNARTNVSTTVVTVAGYSGASMGLGEGNPSNDGRYVAVIATRTSDSKQVVYVADTVAGTKSADIEAVAAGFVNPTDLDWAGVSQSGQYLILFGVLDGTWGRSKIYNRSTLVLVSYWSDNPMGHSDLGVDLNGNDVLFGGTSSGTYAKRFIARRLDTGAITPLTPPISFDWHTSCRNTARPGWGYVVTNDASGTFLDRTIYAVKMDGTQIERMAHHRSIYTDYETYPFACPSPDGKRFIFRSNWGASGFPSRPVYAFVCDVRNICP